MPITGELIRRLRIEARLTQAQLAELVGVSQAHIAKIEQGKVDPRLSTVNRILRVLTEKRVKKCGDIMTRNVISAKPEERITEISEKMVRHGISQVPVIDRDRVIGTVTEESIMRRLGSDIANQTAEEVMTSPLPIVDENMSVEKVKALLGKHQGVLVSQNGKIVGIITRSDVLKALCLPLEWTNIKE